MKRHQKNSRWTNLPGLPVQYLFEGDYFEIRGRIPEHLSTRVFFEKIIEMIQMKGTMNMKRSGVQRNNNADQGDLFKCRFQGELLKNIPVLKGNTSMAEMIKKRQDLAG